MPHKDPEIRRTYQKNRKRTPEQWARKNAIARKWYEANREQHLAACHRYNNSPEGKAKKRAYYLKTREHGREVQRAWKKRNKEKVKASSLRDRQRHPERGTHNAMRRQYGIGLPEYRQMLHAQGGACALCKQTPKNMKHGRPFDVEHDHETGAVRGLVCRPCNNSIAHFERMQRLDLLAAVNTYVAASKALHLVA